MLPFILLYMSKSLYNYIPTSFDILHYSGWMDKKKREPVYKSEMSYDHFPKYNCVIIHSIDKKRIRYIIREYIRTTENNKFVGDWNILKDTDFYYENEKDGIFKLFNILDTFGKSHNNYKFEFELSLYNYLYAIGNKRYDNRKFIIEFINEFKKSGSNMPLLLEIRGLNKISYKNSPKALATKITTKAPLLTSILLDYFNNKEKVSIEELINKYKYIGYTNE